MAKRKIILESDDINHYTGNEWEHGSHILTIVRDLRRLRDAIEDLQP